MDEIDQKIIHIDSIPICVKNINIHNKDILNHCIAKTETNKASPFRSNESGVSNRIELSVSSTRF
jgi:hypothetical protein